MNFAAFEPLDHTKKTKLPVETSLRARAALDLKPITAMSTFSEDQYKTDTMNPIKAQAVPSAPPAVKGSYRSVSQGYDNVPDIELGAGDAVDAHVQRQMRLGFIRKVYGILTCQLALTTIVCSVLALNGACRRFVMTTPSLMYIGMLQCPLSVPSRRAALRRADRPE